MDIAKIKIGELELFLELVKIGSLRELARSRSVEAAHLSRVIKRLEEKLGNILFRRSHRGLIPTPYALKLSKDVESIFKQLNFREDISNDEIVELASVGSPSFLMDSLVLPSLVELYNSDDIHRSDIVELPPDRLVLSGLRGIIKIAYHAGELEWPSTWVSEKIGVLEWGLYGSKKYFNEVNVTEEDVLNIPFVYPIYWSPEGLRESEDKCPVLLRYRKRTFGVATGKMAIELIKDHKSLCYLPNSLITSPNRDELIKLNVEGWPSHEVDIFLSAQIDSVTEKLFRKLIRQSKSVISLKKSSF